MRTNFGVEKIWQFWSEIAKLSPRQNLFFFAIAKLNPRQIYFFSFIAKINPR